MASTYKNCGVLREKDVGGLAKTEKKKNLLWFHLRFEVGGGGVELTYSPSPISYTFIFQLG